MQFCFCANFWSIYCKTWILKMIATSGFLTALECTKFVFADHPPRTLLGELTALPRVSLVGALLPRGGEWQKERDRVGKRGIGRRGERKKVEQPLHQFLLTPVHTPNTWITAAAISMAARMFGTQFNSLFRGETTYVGKVASATHCIQPLTYHSNVTSNTVYLSRQLTLNASHRLQLLSVC